MKRSAHIFTTLYISFSKNKHSDEVFSVYSKYNFSLELNMVYFQCCASTLKKVLQTICLEESSQPHDVVR